MTKKNKVKKKIGRPPASWVYDLADLKRNGNEFLDYHDLSAMFDISLRTVHGFCTKAGVEGEYYKTENKAVRKRFRVKNLKDAANEYVASK